MKSKDQEFLDTIKRETGKDIEKGEFGFIAGTMHPLMENSKGMMSATMKDGFEVWKKVGESYETILIQPKSYEDSLFKIIEFLKS